MFVEIAKKKKNVFRRVLACGLNFPKMSSQEYG